jgi:cytochrome c-type biogenesis protein CcmF
MTEAGIRHRPARRSVLSALGEPLGGDAWAVRVHAKPFERWIGIGALFTGDRRFHHRDRSALPAARTRPHGAAPR